MAELIPAARVAAVLTCLTGLTAIAVHLAAADQARDMLGFTFDGIPPRAGEAVSIFTNNVGVLCAVLAACGTVQLAHRAGDSGWERALFGLAISVCDIALTLSCALHVLLIGCAVGAYGRRTLETVLAHAPFEVAAFSLVLALYLAGRREPLPARRSAGVALVATAALGIGAVLEVFA